MNESWEHAVAWYRAQPGSEQDVRNNYFDLPVTEAARRFAASAEFAQSRALLGPIPGGVLLDYGAGNGIASHAFAAGGLNVDAVEPDPSAEVGAAAVRQLAAGARLPITVHQTAALPLPFEDGRFGAVYARQVLHHVPDLGAAVRELARVLRPGGRLLATREHVADDALQLEQFRARHALHARYGGENAYPLDVYLASFKSAGLRTLRVFGPTDSVINFFPAPEWQRPLQQLLARVRGALGRPDRTPGRLYSFLLER